MPLYDFKCENEECKENGIHCERLCKVGKIATCENCQAPMKKLILPPEGKRVPHVSWSTWRVGIGLKS